MNLPDFHDGFFDGFYIPEKKVVRFFLRTHDEKRYTLLLKGVDALKITEAGSAEFAPHELCGS